MQLPEGRFSHLIRRSIVASLALIAVSTTVASRAHAIEACSDLFLSEYDGLLENRAARADMVFKISKLIPRGQYTVLVDGVQKKQLTVTYSDMGELEMMLGSQLLITNRPAPTTRNKEGFTNKTSVRMQLLLENRLLITNTIVAGNYDTPEGIVRRDLSLEITLDRLHEADARTITLVTATSTETSSRYNETQRMNERHTFDVHVPAAPVRRTSEVVTP